MHEEEFIIIKQVDKITGSLLYFLRGHMNQDRGTWDTPHGWIKNARANSSNYIKRNQKLNKDY